MPRHWNSGPGVERWSTRALRWEIAEKERFRRENFILVVTTLGAVAVLLILDWLGR